MISLYCDNGLPLTRYHLTEITSTYVNFSGRFLDRKKYFMITYSQLKTYIFLNCSFKVALVRLLCRHAVFNLITYFKTDTG